MRYFVAVALIVAVCSGCTWSVVTADNKLWVQDKAARQEAFCKVVGALSSEIPASVAEREKVGGFDALPAHEQNIILKANAAANNASWALWDMRIQKGWAAPNFVADVLGGEK